MHFGSSKRDQRSRRLRAGILTTGLIGISSLATNAFAFETGTLEGWQAVGNATVIGTLSGETDIDPNVGAFQAFLNGDEGDRRSASVLASSLGVTVTELNDAAGAFATDGVGLVRNVFLFPGSTFTYDWNFLSNENGDECEDFPDSAVFVAEGNITVLANAEDACSFPDGGDFDHELGYDSGAYAFTGSGITTFGFAIFNVYDTAEDPGLLVDNVMLNGLPMTWIPDLVDSSDTGVYDDDDITYETFPEFQGYALPNATVEVFSDVEGSLGTTTSDGTGYWSMISSVEFSEGQHIITTTADDTVDVVDSPAGLLVTIDTTPPAGICGDFSGVSVPGPNPVLIHPEFLVNSQVLVQFSEPVVYYEDVFDLDGSDAEIVYSQPAYEPASNIIFNIMPYEPGYVYFYQDDPVEDIAGNEQEEPVGPEVELVFIDSLTEDPDGNRIAADDGEYNDRYGTDIALSGEDAFVGAPSDDDAALNGGAVYVLHRDTPGSYTQIQKLTAPVSFSDDRFGESVASSGDWLVVGSPYRDNPRRDSGEVNIYRRESHIRKDVIGGPWIYHSTVIPSVAGTYFRFGFDVSIFGRYMAVSAPLAYQPSALGGVYRSGLVFVFEYDECSDTWNEVAVLQASDATANDNFGNSIAMDEFNLVVGSPFDDDFGASTGSAYIYNRGTDNVWREIRKLTSPIGDRANYFGHSVDIDGPFAIAGEPGFEDIGSAWVFADFGWIFEEVPGGWDIFDLVTGSIEEEDPQLFARFGEAVAIENATIGDLDTPLGVILVGAPKHSESATKQGAAFLFAMTFDFIFEGIIPVAKITADDANRYDYYGSSVSTNGMTFGVGSPFGNDMTLGVPGTTDTGSGYIYRLDQFEGPGEGPRGPNPIPGPDPE